MKKTTSKNITISITSFVLLVVFLYFAGYTIGQAIGYLQ